MVLCPACGGEPESSPLDKPEVTQAVPLPSAPLPKREGSHASSDWQVGDVILDTYEVKGELGQGGFGKVYRVHHKSWNIDLAVKRSLKIEPGSRQSFIEEAEKWVDLGLHPNIVSCYYVRTIDDFPHTFAELAEGGSLEKWIRTGKLYEGQRLDSLKRILDIAIQFAWGLGYAHERGLVHQDVKPDNVLMGAGEVAKVTDFGLARARSRGGAAGASGMVSDASVSAVGGTVAYMSPEQSAGQRLTLKTDLWSWGVSVLEMLTGEVTWYSGAAALDVLEDYASPGSELAADAKIVSPPGQLVDLLRQCFSYEPVQRPADMLEVAGRLQEIYRREVGQAYPRQLPKAAELRADSLNNRALSLLELEKPKEAQTAWNAALKADPMHVDASLNLVLWRWRTGEVSDDIEWVRQLETVAVKFPGCWQPYFMLGCAHMERGDGAAAREALQKIQGADSQKSEVISALELAKSEAANLRKLVRTFEGHRETVTSVSLSSDGRYALSGSDDQTLKLWEVASGICLRSFEGHASGVTGVCLSQDGHYALSGSDDNTLKLWDTTSGRCLRTMSGHTGQVLSVSLSQDGRIALSGSTDETIRVWDVTNGRCLRILEGQSGQVLSVSLSGDGRIGLSGSSEETLKIWDLSSGFCQHTLSGHESLVCGTSLSADGRIALSGSSDETIKLWDVTNGRCRRTWEGHTDVVLSVFLSADGCYAISGSDDKTIKLWEVKNGRCLRTFMGYGASMNSVCLSRDGRFALAACSDNTLKLWEVQLGKKTSAAPYLLTQARGAEEVLSSQEIYEAALQQARQAAKNDQVLEAAKRLRQARAQPGYARAEETLEMWRGLYSLLPRKTLREGWEAAALKGHTALINSVCFSSNGRRALSGSSDHTFKLWDTASFKCLQTFKGHTEWVKSVCLSVDGRYALSGSWDSTLKLWEIESGRCLRTFSEHQGGVSSVCLSAGGRYALSGSEDQTLKLWETASGRCLRTFTGHSDAVKAVNLSADSCYALSGSKDLTLKLWDMTSGRCLRSFEGHTKSVTSTCLSLDGLYALSGSRDKTLKLWELASGRCLRTFEGHGDIVSSVSLSADGRFALSGSDDKIRVWDIASGRVLQAFEWHTKGVESTWDAVDTVALSLDGRFALSGHDGRLVRLWALDWELEDKEPAYWDEGARPHLEIFLTLHTPYAAALPQSRTPTEDEITLALTRRGRPTWTDEDFKGLLYTLGCAGYGWLKPEGVRKELERMASGRK
jgi:WD40 repeat protein